VIFPTCAGGYKIATHKTDPHLDKHRYASELAI
jgi:hypothetical protein